MKIKVIIENGVVSNVVKNCDDPVEVEIISIDNDNKDRKDLEEYRAKIYADPNYMDCDYVTTNFVHDEIDADYGNHDAMVAHRDKGDHDDMAAYCDKRSADSTYKN